MARLRHEFRLLIIMSCGSQSPYTIVLSFWRPKCVLCLEYQPQVVATVAMHTVMTVRDDKTTMSYTGPAGSAPLPEGSIYPLRKVKD